MSNVHLSIGTATDRISLVQPSIIGVYEWEPSETPLADTFSESSLGDGRILSSYREENAIETFRFHLKGYDPDALIRVTQDIRRMLIMARNYWVTAWQGYPVYLQARGACETNFRYAVVFTGSLPSDTLPWGYGFARANVMEERTLVIERGPWMNSVPGSGSCIELTASQTRCYPWCLEFDGADDRVNARSDAQLDDVISTNGQLEVDGWIKPDGYVTGQDSAIISKYDFTFELGWLFKLVDDPLEGLYAEVVFDEQDAVSCSGQDEFPPGGSFGDWIYVYFCIDQNVVPATPVSKQIYLNINGVWVATYDTSQVGIGNYASEASANCLIGDGNPVTIAPYDGYIGWLRVRDTITRVVGTDFDPPARCTYPMPAATVMGQWIHEGTGVTTGNNGAGTTAADISGAEWVCDCPETFGSDAESPEPEPVSFVGARAYSDVNISVTSGVWRSVPLNQERWDVGDIHSTVVVTERMYAPITGKYTITGHVQWAYYGLGTRWLALKLNGATWIAYQSENHLGYVSETDAHYISRTFELTAGDYIEMWAYQDSGILLNILSTGNQSPELTMHLITET